MATHSNHGSVQIQLRKRFIVDYRLPYPSSTVAGIVLNSLHVKGSQQRAVRQARPLACPCWLGGLSTLKSKQASSVLLLACSIAGVLEARHGLRLVS